MSLAAIRVLPALVGHISHLLSFRHDGQGLPLLKSSGLVHLVGMKLVLTGFVVAQLFPEIGLTAGVLKSAIAVFALYVLASVSRQFYAFSGYLLAWSGIEIGLLVLHQAVGPIPVSFMNACYAWGLLAFVVLLIRAASNHEKNTS